VTNYAQKHKAAYANTQSKQVLRKYNCCIQNTATPVLVTAVVQPN